MTDIRRRKVLQGMAIGTGLALTGSLPARAADGRRGAVAGPGSRPDPTKPEGTDLLPGIEHIIIYMQENHSYDSYFGMLGRGDGYTVVDGVATNANLDPTGASVPVFHADGTCQLGRGVSQNWNATHTQIAGGAMSGFLANGNINAMKYWDRTDLPFYWSLAETFPICDRWFSSAPCQTYPNRMFLQAATSLGMVATDTGKVFNLPHPAGGTIWDKLNDFGITWHDYAWDLPDIALFQKTWKANGDKVKSFDQFLLDCRSGALPSVSIVSPGIAVYTEENPADVQLGEAFSASVINAVMHSPAWEHTVLLFMYDEHGGYYDHVAPPAAIAPDDIAPMIDPARDLPGGFDLLGPRVPGFVISPFSRPDYVSHVVHEHTSVLRLIETKFNLGALTFRDANASNLLDSLDLEGPPAFLEPPALAAPGLPATGSTCEDTPPPPTEPRTAPPPTTTATTSTVPGPVAPIGPLGRGALARTGSQDARLALLGAITAAAGAAALTAERIVVSRTVAAARPGLVPDREAESSEPA